MKKTIHYLLSAVLLACWGCEGNENEDLQAQPSVEYIFEPVVTEMAPSSAIALPDGTDLETSVINSEQELRASLPSDVLQSASAYENLDFSGSSLLSLKFRSYYKPEFITYQIVRDGEGQIILQQQIFVCEPLHIEGYFVLSNLATSKLNTGAEPVLEQKITFFEKKSDFSLEVQKKALP